MKVAEKIVKEKVDDEFRICPACSYEFGFHMSFQKQEGEGFRVVLICPNCGARYDVGLIVDINR